MVRVTSAPRRRAASRRTWRELDSRLAIRALLRPLPARAAARGSRRRRARPGARGAPRATAGSASGSTRYLRAASIDGPDAPRRARRAAPDRPRDAAGSGATAARLRARARRRASRVAARLLERRIERGGIGEPRHRRREARGRRVLRLVEGVDARARPSRSAPARGRGAGARPARRSSAAASKASASSSRISWPSSSRSRAELACARSRAARCSAARRQLAVAAGDLPRQGLAAAEGVEQRALAVALEQQLVLVLAVDVDQQLAQLAQLRGGGRAPVHERARAAGRVHGAAHEAGAVALVEILRREPFPRRAPASRTSNSALTSARSAPARTTPGSARPPSASASASTRIDLPAPVSPVSAVKPARELEVEPLDDDEVADGEAPAASRKPLRRSARSSAASGAASRSSGSPSGAGAWRARGARRTTTTSPGSSSRCACTSKFARASTPRTSVISTREVLRIATGRLESVCGEIGTSAIAGERRMQDRPARRERIGGRAGGRGHDEAVGAQVVDELAVHRHRDLDHAAHGAAAHHHVVHRERGEDRVCAAAHRAAEQHALLRARTRRRGSPRSRLPAPSAGMSVRNPRRPRLTPTSGTPRVGHEARAGDQRAVAAHDDREVARCRKLGHLHRRVGRRARGAGGPRVHQDGRDHGVAAPSRAGRARRAGSPRRSCRRRQRS